MQKMMVAVTLATLIAAPAHAISAKYREQLERSGCTQVSESQGCDIHKTKAQNASAAKHPKPAAVNPGVTINVTPYIGKWNVKNEEGLALHDLVVRKDAVLFGGDKVLLTTQHISDGALYLGFGVMMFTLKKNGEGRWVSEESSGTLKRQN